MSKELSKEGCLWSGIDCPVAKGNIDARYISRFGRVCADCLVKSACRECGIANGHGHEEICSQFDPGISTYARLESNQIPGSVTILPPGVLRVFTTEAESRKAAPLCTGVLDYFPDALMEVARLSKIGNEQHNPGQPMHWAKEKSTDEADALLRHLKDRGKRDSDGVRHSTKVAWRGLALLQRELDAENSK